MRAAQTTHMEPSMPRQTSALSRIEQLDTERMLLVEEAKSEVLQTIDDAIARLERLGFSFELVEKGRPSSTGRVQARSNRSAGKIVSTAPRRGGRKKTSGKGVRRAGIRQDVLGAIAASGKKGMTRGDLIADFRATDSSFKQSISNALAALKKQKQVKATGGVYRAA
jgi:hypothetical protein